MRDVVVFGLFLIILPLSFMRPWVGLCAFAFLAFNRTQDLTWGFARGLPISQLIGIAMISGWLIMEFRPLPLRDVRVKAMGLIVLLVGWSIVANKVRWGTQGDRFIELFKVILVVMMTGALMNTRRRLRQMSAVVAVALGFYGLKNGLLLMVGSRSIAGPGGMLKDNNDFALAMTMNFPLLIYLHPEVSRLGGKAGKWLGRFMFAAGPATLLAVMSTGSRGGFLSLGTGMMIMAWRTKYKIPAVMLLGVVGVLGVTFAPQEYKDRIASMFVSLDKQDESVQGRLTSWLVAKNMIVENPFFGIGFNNMVWEYNNYTTGIVNKETGEEQHFARVAHNSYLQLWAESGTFAYLSFMFMLVGSIVMLGRLAAKAKREGDDWVIPYCRALQTAMISFMLGATFLNRAHFDLIYHLVIMGVSLPNLIQVERVRRVVDKEDRGPGPQIADRVWVRNRDPFVRAGA